MKRAISALGCAGFSVLNKALMRQIFLPWILLAALATARGEATSDDAPALANRLETAFSQDKTMTAAPSLAGLHARLHFIVAEQDTRAAKKLVKNLADMGASKEVQEVGASWIKQVERDQYNRQKALGNAIQVAVAKASAACRDAHEEADLNEVQRALGKLKEELANDASPQDMDPAFQTMLKTASEAVSSWQDYLALHQAGYDQQAKAKASQVSNFVNGQQNFAGARNVEAVLNADGSIDLTWENVSDNIRELRVAARPKVGAPVVLATLPPEATSYHVPPPGTTETFPKGLDGPIIVETIPK